MIADLKPYPEYKESGLPWLGRVPGHWTQERAKWLFTKMDRPVDEDRRGRYLLSPVTQYRPVAVESK